jgi:hypothetical protein
MEMASVPTGSCDFIDKIAWRPLYAPSFETVVWIVFLSLGFGTLASRVLSLEQQMDYFMSVRMPY